MKREWCGIEKAEEEIKKLHESGLSFDYEFDNDSVNKPMLAIEMDGYSIEDIINKCEPGEKVKFYLNSGEKWNGEMGNSTNFFFSKKREGSIYWKHETYGECIRVDNESIREWLNNKEWESSDRIVNDNLSKSIRTEKDAKVFDLAKIKNGFEEKLKLGYEEYLKLPKAECSGVNRDTELYSSRWCVMIDRSIIHPHSHRHYTFLEFVYWCGKDETLYNKFL